MSEGHQPHILLVEDYKANVMVATALLDIFGYSYAVANNGQEAIDLVKTQPFDLVLMDVQMPGIGGFEATQLIREWEKDSGNHIPIVGMTAHSLKGDRELCINAGMDDYLAKPFHPDEFESRIQKNLRKAA